MVRINIFRTMEINQSLATIQGVFIQEKWLHLHQKQWTLWYVVYSYPPPIYLYKYIMIYKDITMYIIYKYGHINKITSVYNILAVCPVHRHHFINISLLMTRFPFSPSSISSASMHSLLLDPLHSSFLMFTAGGKNGGLLGLGQGSH